MMARFGDISVTAHVKFDADGLRKLALSCLSCTGPDGTINGRDLYNTLIDMADEVEAEQRAGELDRMEHAESTS